MRFKTILSCSLCLLAAQPIGAQPWTLGECTPELRDKLGQRQKAMADLRPVERSAVPHPVPRTEEQVLEDARFVYFRSRQGQAPESLPDKEKPLYAGLENGTLDVEVARVENWTPLRCIPGNPLGWYHLLRLHDAESGKEIARISLTRSGELASLVIFGDETDRDRVDVPTLAEATERVRVLSGERVDNAQYVFSFGGGRCDPLYPCIALEGPTASGGAVYLFSTAPREELFVFDRASPRATDAEMNARRRERPRPGAAEGAADRGIDPPERFFSLGGDEWVAAKRVEPVRRP